MSHNASSALHADANGTEAQLRPTSVSAYGGTWEESQYGPVWLSDGTNFRLESTPLDIAPALRFESWTLTPAGPSGKIKDELVQGERLIWSGRPRQGLHVGVANDIAVAAAVVFLLGLTGFATSFAVRSLLTDRAASQIMIPSGMACVGLFFIAYILWLEPRGRSKTSYGLSDRRALIISGQLRPTLESIPLKATGTVHLKLHNDGSGSITFADFVRQCGEDDCSPTFKRVENAKRVHELVMAALSDRTARRSKPTAIEKGN